ncbi:hypothetical protein RJT34_13054 [Clitoria ternatea]|uniref:Uncharacterized protein n=1 Tax=Clitoria ternatea TaxID=43366 RepID=A0AAN9JQH5_CLITE
MACQTLAEAVFISHTEAILNGEYSSSYFNKNNVPACWAYALLIQQKKMVAAKENFIFKVKYIKHSANW